MTASEAPRAASQRSGQSALHPAEEDRVTASEAPRSASQRGAVVVDEGVERGNDSDQAGV